MENTEDSVNVLKFAESRAREIQALMLEVSTKDPKQCKQKLPYHMRRRAASHNPKRLPRSLRIKANEETPTKKKKKHKTHKSLLEEYNKRQTDSVWLPTHIWFAKRFHMKKIWGYQLPMQATGKRFRSSYRATTGKVLVQDLSYYSCIELRGERGKLLTELSSLTNDSLGMDFAAESYINGLKEGHCVLYRPHSFPFNAIGPVSFLWRPCLDLGTNDMSSSLQQLWIWCHPTIHDELIKVLIDIFNLKEKDKTDEVKSKQYHFASKTNYMKTKLHFQKEKVYANDDVVMVILKNSLIRHRLIGPKALSVLTSVLNIRNPDEVLHDKVGKADHSEKMDIAESTEENSAILSAHISVKQKVWNYLTNAKSSYSVPLKTVIGLTVDDPRLYVTTKKPDILDEDITTRGGVTTLDEFSDPALAVSALWNEDIRNQVTASQVPEHILNNERAKYVIPTASELRKCTSSVPVIVIHQPGVNGYGSGWDLIAPLGWGMAFWIPFIYHGSQPAGLDDFCCINLESSCLSFPYSFPDTKAGASCEEKIREEHLKKFYRYSRAKRPNFKILGVSTPFFMPWDILVSDWEKNFLNEHLSAPKTLKSEHVFASIVEKDDEMTLFTLRGLKPINFLRHLCMSLHKIKHHNSDELLRLKDMYNTLVQTLITPKNVYVRSVVSVKVKCLFRGTPFRFSGIYIPSELDLENLKENPKYFGPVEQQHAEYPNLPPKKKRKLLKEEARKDMKKLDRPDVTNIIASCDRKLIGYISEGGYCRLGGQGRGIGHCALTGFLTAFELCMKFMMNVTVLVREQHVFQYRFANIEIIENPF